MKRINAKQLEWIEGLRCERLTHNPDNEEIILSFDNQWDSLVKHLHEDAWREDTENDSVHYLVKSKENEVLLYFSLRCGLLYDDMLVDDRVDMCRAYAGEILMTEDIKKKIKEYQIDNSLSDKELNEKLDKLYHKLRYQRKVVKTDAQVKESAQIRVVLDTIPAIELKHFCKNEHYAGFDKELFRSYKLGEVIFWFKILPLVEEIFKMIGGKYIYLFAADEDENRTLTNHYKTRLKFSDQSEWGVNKPTYSNLCRFLCLSMEDALKHKTHLIDNFNLSEEEVI